MALKRNEPRVFIDDIERAYGRKFSCRTEIELLVELAEKHSLRPVFDDMIFYAKFVTRASGILARTGPMNEETEKLSREYAESLERVSLLIKRLLKEAPQDVAGPFANRFLSLSQESVRSLMVLLQELSWVKNYILDRERNQA
jgi:hypothetical protein